MLIGHVLASIAAQASGPSYSVPGLAKALAAIGNDVEVHTVGEQHHEAVGRYSDIRHALDWPKDPVTRKLAKSSAMKRSLLATEFDILHGHGLWLMPNIYPADMASRKNIPLLLSPRGMLGEDALQFSNRIKGLFWFLFQHQAAERVSSFHATSVSEYEDIRRAGLKQPVAIIPNGIDIPDFDLMPARQGNNRPFILSLGRIHPKKGLDRLVRAWASVESEFPQWALKIVGPDERGHVAELKRLVQQLGLKNVHILPPSFADEKIELMRNAELFVLPTLNENFAMTVAESLAVATPVISTKGAPWAELEQHGCGWWVDHGETAMAAAIKSALRLSANERAQMGQRGRSWMASSFGWPAIAVQMLDVYRWLKDEGSIPDWVVKD
jgi:glycosyltransferase involved in cell wall biosynthesis